MCVGFYYAALMKTNYEQIKIRKKTKIPFHVQFTTIQTVEVNMIFLLIFFIRAAPL